MSCFVFELCSIGGCPLEEACEHFSLSNKIIAILCSHILCSGIFLAYSLFGIALQVKKHNTCLQQTILLDDIYCSQT